jgi:hypothetical protein
VGRKNIFLSCMICPILEKLLQYLNTVIPAQPAKALPEAVQLVLEVQSADSKYIPTGSPCILQQEYY